MKHQSIDKKQVQKGFVKSIETYRKHAIVQEAIASRLINELLNQPLSIYSRVLEIGCGPAVLTDKYFQQFDADVYYANDIVKEYGTVVSSINSKIQFLPGDIEELRIPNSLNLIISSSTFQWFSNLEKFLSKIHQSLTPNGLLVFSTFGPENYREIREISGKGLNYLSFGKHEKLLSDKFEVLWSDRETITRFFPNPIGVLSHMKQTGVNSISGKAWTKNDLKKFEEDYWDLFGIDLGVPLTYQPLYFIAKPKK